MVAYYFIATKMMVLGIIVQNMGCAHDVTLCEKRRVTKFYVLHDLGSVKNKKKIKTIRKVIYQSVDE